MNVVFRIDGIVSSVTINLLIVVEQAMTLSCFVSQIMLLLLHEFSTTVDCRLHVCFGGQSVNLPIRA